MYKNSEIKRCCTCRKEKHLTEFYYNKVSPDGRIKRCKDCNAQYAEKAQNAREQHDTPIPNEKYCPQCDTTRPNNQFWKNKCRKDGLNNICSFCAAEEKNKYKKIDREVPEFKKCSDCGEVKKTTEYFNKRCTSVDGYQGKCKDCSNAYFRNNRVQRKQADKKC